MRPFAYSARAGRIAKHQRVERPYGEVSDRGELSSIVEDISWCQCSRSGDLSRKVDQIVDPSLSVDDNIHKEGGYLILVQKNLICYPARGRIDKAIREIPW